MGSLEHQLKRLMLFRVVMITTLLLVAVYVESVSETLLPVNPLYFPIIATYVLTVVYALALRFSRAYEAQAWVQVVLDLLIITGLVYLTGAAAPGFMLLYPIAVLSASILLYRRQGMLVAGLGVLFYAGMVLAVRTGNLPPPGVSELASLPLRRIIYSIFVIGVACGTVALIGSYLAESLKRVGERLEEATERVAGLQQLHTLVVDSIHSGLVTADPAGRVLYLNPFGQAMLGLGAEPVTGRRLRDVFGSILLEAPALEARVRNRTLKRFDLTYLRPDGVDRQLGISISPLAAPEPVQRGYLLVFQDLTDIRRLEGEVRARERLAAAGEMAAQLAHEIRNPLGSISGSAQILMGETGFSEEQGKLLAIITRESRRLSDVLNAYLGQTRTTGGRREPVDIAPLIEEAVALLRNSPELASGHQLHLEVRGGPHLCMADPHQITQVFWNLARNGLEAMPAGGLLSVRLVADGDEVALSVHDQGRGMTSEEQQRVFRTVPSQPGFGGLGLAIVYRIVREHGGDIVVRSMPGHGTDVQIRLPRVAVSVPA